MKKFLAVTLFSLVLALPVFADEPLVIQTQGSFAIGGSTVTHEGEFSEKKFLEPYGQKAYGDHAYVFFQVSVNAKKYPLIFQHGGACSKGFQDIFLRKGFSVYLLNQPRIGEAGIALVPDKGQNPYAYNLLYADGVMFMLCRLGYYENDKPVVFENAAFPKDDASIEQFHRSFTPYTGQLDDEISANALTALFEKNGPAILITHSMGGSPFVFPEGELPEPVTACYTPVSARAVEFPKDFEKITRIPIVLYYGDNIADLPYNEVGADKWRTEIETAQKFVDAINRHSWRAKLVHLPKIGIKGNTHFIMNDLNNQEVADVMKKWINQKVLNVK